MLLSITVRNNRPPELPVLTRSVCVQDVYIHRYRFHTISNRYAVRSTRKLKNRTVTGDEGPQGGRGIALLFL